jgi:predicted permease
MEPAGDRHRVCPANATGGNMSLSAYLRSIAGKFLHRQQVAQEMDDEVQSHIQFRADDLERSGLTRAEAERRARLEFGGQERVKQECHEAMGANFLDVLMQDLRFAFRMLRKSPSFTVLAVLTLTLAIGANAVVFGVLDGLILRPLNVPQPESLWATVYGEDPGFQSYLNYRDLRDRNHTFEDLAAFNFAFVGLDTGKDPTVASGFATTGNYFNVLGVHPYLGRFFGPSDERGPNSAPYLVLTYAYWHSRFQDDPGVIGRTVQLNKHPFTIIGVTQSEFHGTLMFISPDFFMPIMNQEQVEGQDLLNNRDTTHGIFEVMGHLKPGVTKAQAEADINSVGAYLEKTYPKQFAQKNATLSRAGLTAFGGAVRQFMTGLMLLAGLILLAACANLGGLFAARAADRSREVAMRLALGSSRKRILRQLLTEAVMISLVGGTIGLFVSIVVLRRISLWQPFPVAPLHLPVNPDAKIYIVALLLALVSGLLFGIVPIRQVLRANPYEVVKAGSSHRIGRRINVRDVLLVGQIAICAVLVTSSMVALRGLVRSLHSSLGFEPHNTMLVATNLAMAGYTNEQLPEMQKRMIDALETIQGVERVGLVNNYAPLVYAAGSRTNVFKEETTDLRPSSVAARPYRYDVSEEYFHAAGTAMLAGRDISWHDDKNSPAVAVVNRQFAVNMFGSVHDAVGRYYKLQDGKRVQVVGVVENGKYMSLTEDPEPAIFPSFLQSPTSATDIVVRSSRDPQQLAADIRSQLHDLDSGLPIDTATWTTELDLVLFPARMATMALGALGLMGGILSITGIFGMAAYSVSRRLRELGIRIALGGRRKEVLHVALGRAVKLLAIGSAAGLIVGVLASRVLAFIVYQATPGDPLVLCGAVLAMALLGLLATWIPARRALAVNPLMLLREE